MKNTVGTHYRTRRQGLIGSVEVVDIASADPSYGLGNYVGMTPHSYRESSCEPCKPAGTFIITASS